MTVIAIVNRASGTASDMDLEAFAEKFVEKFAEAGRDIDVRLESPDGFEAALDDACASSAETIIVGGGDGTINGAAARLAGTDKTLGILPLGTVNRLARDLNIPLKPDAAVDALAAAEAVQIDVAYVNDRLFTCNCFMGAQPLISEEREALRGRNWSERVLGYFHLLRSISDYRRRIAVIVDDGDRRRAERVLSLAVTNNLYRETPSLVLERHRLDGSSLGIYMSKHRSGLGMLWVLVKATLGFWRGDRDLVIREAETLQIETRSGSVKVTYDGELERMETPLCFRSAPGALRVLAPKAP